MWFDANGNKTLDPTEADALDTMIQVLAEKYLAEYDSDEDGRLTSIEFEGRTREVVATGGFQSPPFPQQLDANRDDRLDADELASFLTRQIRLRVQPKYPPRWKPPGGQLVEPAALFKEQLEAYWQDPTSITNRPKGDYSPGLPPQAKDSGR